MIKLQFLKLLSDAISTAGFMERKMANGKEL